MQSSGQHLDEDLARPGFRSGELLVPRRAVETVDDGGVQETVLQYCPSSRRTDESI
jgi:hypothetical protein